MLWDVPFLLASTSPPDGLRMYTKMMAITAQSSTAPTMIGISGRPASLSDDGEELREDASVAGASVGAAVGGIVAEGVSVGETVGLDDLGLAVGQELAGLLVGIAVGDSVGVELVGAMVGGVVSRMQVWSRELQSPSEQRWVLAQLQR